MSNGRETASKNPNLVAGHAYKIILDYILVIAQVWFRDKATIDVSTTDRSYSTNNPVI